MTAQMYHYAPSQPPAPTSAFAVVSLITGLLWFCWLGSIAAVVFGHLGLKECREQGLRGDGVAIAGLVLGYFGVATLALFIILMVAGAAV